MEQSQPDEKTLDTVAGHLATARRVLFVTGAGLSADSGLPTYRGIGGIYDSGVTEHGMTIEEALSGETFRRQPELTWKHILEIESACRGATFNPGHEIIARLEQHLPDVWVLTQNVDGFHYAAGSRNVIEIHGNLHNLHCTNCVYRTQAPDYSQYTGIPSCPQCGAVVRPAVVLFGEELPMRAVMQLHALVAQGFDMVFMVGTTAVFPYIAEPALQARYSGAPTVEINPGISEMSSFVDYRLGGRAADVLPALWRRLTQPA